MIVKCDYCGKEIDKPKCYIERTKHNFCSHECNYAWRRENKGSIFTCEYCGKEFKRQPCEVASNEHIFCSFKCSNLWRRENQGSFAICDYCGVKYKRIPSELAKYEHHFCSNECKDRHSERQAMVICENCGKAYSKNICYIERTNTNFCSQECFVEATTNRYSLTCQNCGQQFDRVASEAKKSKHFHFCSHLCYSTWHQGENHLLWQGGTYPYSADFTKKLKKQIRSRDGYICQECGVTETELGHALHVHHLNYDPHDCRWTNLVSLCNSCHAKTNFSRDDWMKHFERKLVNTNQVDSEELILPFFRRSLHA